jgi:nitroreductase
MIENQELLQSLNWRYATKKFDPTRKIPAEDWAVLEEALRLSPSSYGLQPWKFIVVTNQAVKEQLVPFSWDQRQIADCSHLVVFTFKKIVTEEDADAFVAFIARTRGVAPETLNFYRDMMVGDIVKGPRSKIADVWASRQTYIAMGNFLTCAALLGLDVCPMEGLDPLRYDEILGLTESAYRTVAACPVGYRASDDKYASLAKVRFPASDVIRHID